MRAVPQAMVHPMWPWPTLKRRFLWRLVSEDGWAVRRHGAQAGPVVAAVPVCYVGEHVAGEAHDVVEIARCPGTIVAGELRGRRETQPVTQPRPAHQPLPRPRPGSWAPGRLS
jgi:hypothetical protein